MFIETMKVVLPQSVYEFARLRCRSLLGLFRRYKTKDGIVQLRGVSLDVADPLVTPLIREYVLRGNYESHEARLVQRLLQPSDRVLELGAGMGYLTIFTSKIVGDQNVFTFEANPGLEHLIRRNFMLNNVSPNLEIAMLGDGDGEETLFVAADFFASSMHSKNKGAPVSVPKKDLNQTIANLEPTVLLMDIEGGEIDIVRALIPGSIRLIMIECHPNLVGQDGLDKMEHHLENLGFQSERYGEESRNYQYIGKRGP